MTKHANICFVVLALVIMGFPTIICGNNVAQGSEISDLVLKTLSTKPRVKGGTPRYQTFPTDWKIIQCDEEPSVVVNGYYGYRIVFESPVILPDYRNLPQMTSKTPVEKTYVTYGSVCIDLVLISSSEVKDKVDKNKIPWLKFTQYCYPQIVDMGEGYGYHWYAKAPILFLDPLRESVKLSGGDDRLQILIDSTTINDTHNYSAGYAIRMLEIIGPKALPYIKKAINEHLSANPENLIGILSRIPGKDATSYLLSLCESDNKTVSDYALYTLINKPYKEAAKTQYMTLLQRGKYIDKISEACIQFGWIDAITKIKQMSTCTTDWRTYRTVYENIRILENRPVSSSLKDAEKSICLLGSIGNEKKPSQEEIGQAKHTILTSEDKEYAAVVAVSLAVYNAKANVKPVQEVGFELLRSIPKEITQPVIKVLNMVDRKNRLIDNG